MSKQSIQFACILFMLAAILAVSAQDSTSALNNASMNNTTLLNNTTQVAPTSEPIIEVANESAIETPALPIETANETALNKTALNETAAEVEVPAPAPEANPTENETQVAAAESVAPQNETAPAPALEAAPSENATTTIETIPAIPVVQPGGIMIGSVQRNAFVISGIGRTPNQFSIDGKALAQGAYEVGLPAKTIMDLSALPFFINKI